MFRGISKTKLDPSNFGAGSFVIEHKHKYLVIASRSLDSVCLFDMETFQLVGDWIVVEDSNFLSQDETRELVHNLNGTFTDFDFDPKGMK